MNKSASVCAILHTSGFALGGRGAILWARFIVAAVVHLHTARVNLPDTARRPHTISNPVPPLAAMG
jgi:hypothetical protein